MEQSTPQTEWVDDDPDQADVSLDVLEDRYEQSLSAENATDSAFEAMAEGLVYSPPETSPIEIGGEDDAFVAPVAEDNDELARAIIDALDGNANTIDFRIHFRVRDGVVTLSGRVPTRDDADEVERTVYAVAGVERVVSHVEVAGG